MSGTSFDAIDAVLVDFSKDFPQLVASYSHNYSSEMRQRISRFVFAEENNLEQMASLDVELGELFVLAANTLLQQAGCDKKTVKAIGSHGQTIRHRPDSKTPFTLQIADPNVIAAHTGITTVADFRRRDIAEGGQGAPFAPAFHAAFYRGENRDRVVLNLGGIANITYLPAASDELIGFDTGPANCLLDAWCEKQLAKAFDKDGEWAATGAVNQALLQSCLRDSYFTKNYPKSTGREYFNLQWLEQFEVNNIPPQDVQATLVELTAVSIAQAIKSLAGSAELLLCGGGVNNAFLEQRIRANLGADFHFRQIEELGLPPQWIEASAFAWLAKQRLELKAVDLRSVTGAKNLAVLGCVSLA
jgi:anhydro-N-acetylmuramic acid kinase